MRIPLLPLLVFLSGTAQAQGARMDTSDGEPRIVVTVTKSARIIPDRATLYFLVEGTGETPGDAAQRASQKLESVTGALGQGGSSAETISVLPYGVMPAPNLRGYPGATTEASYVARFAVRAQLTRLDQITPLAATAITAGAGSSAAPAFESSGADSARRVRFTEALAAAKQDAEALASALGGRLGALIEVSTTGMPGPGTLPPYISFMNRFEMGGPTQSPDVQISATVTARYRFIPR